MLAVSATTISSSKEMTLFLPGPNISLACALTQIRDTWDSLGIGKFREMHAQAAHKRRERSKTSILKRNPRILLICPKFEFPKSTCVTCIFQSIDGGCSDHYALSMLTPPLRPSLYCGPYHPAIYKTLSRKLFPCFQSPQILFGLGMPRHQHAQVLLYHQQRVELGGRPNVLSAQRFRNTTETSFWEWVDGSGARARL